MVELANKISEKYHNWRTSVQERELLKQEEGLRERTLLLGTMLSIDKQVPKVARALFKGNSKPTPHEGKVLLFTAFAKIHIPADSSPDFDYLRRIFSEGTYQLFNGQSLKDLAQKGGLSWSRYLESYRRASEIVFNHQAGEFVKK